MGAKGPVTPDPEDLEESVETNPSSLPPPGGGRRSFLANIFEHTIKAFNRYSAFPRKDAKEGGGIKWPAFYEESIFNEDKSLNFGVLAKKAAIFLGCLVLASALVATIVFTGGLPLGFGFGALAAYGAITMGVAFGLPGLPFTASVFARTLRKAVWTLLAGPVLDILDNIFIKAPKALFSPIKALFAPLFKKIGERFKNETILDRNVPVEETPGVNVASGLTFSVIERPNGEIFYRPDKHFDEITDEDKKAFLRSISEYHNKKHAGSKSSVHMDYSSDEARNEHEANDRDFINSEMVKIKSASPVTPSASSASSSATPSASSSAPAAASSSAPASVPVVSIVSSSPSQPVAVATPAAPAAAVPAAVPATPAAAVPAAVPATPEVAPEIAKEVVKPAESPAGPPPPKTADAALVVRQPEPPVKKEEAVYKSDKDQGLEKDAGEGPEQPRGHKPG